MDELLTALGAKPMEYLALCRHLRLSRWMVAGMLRLASQNRWIMPARDEWGWSGGAPTRLWKLTPLGRWNLRYVVEGGLRGPWAFLGETAAERGA